MDTFAPVDDDDYEKVKPYNWFLSGTGAVAFVPVDGSSSSPTCRFVMDAQSGQCVTTSRLFADNRRDNLRLATHARTDRTGASARCLRQG